MFRTKDVINIVLTDISNNPVEHTIDSKPYTFKELLGSIINTDNSFIITEKTMLRYLINLYTKHLFFLEDIDKDITNYTRYNIRIVINKYEITNKLQPFHILRSNTHVTFMRESVGCSKFTGLKILPDKLVRGFRNKHVITINDFTSQL